MLTSIFYSVTVHFKTNSILIHFFLIQQPNSLNSLSVNSLRAFPVNSLRAFPSILLEREQAHRQKSFVGIDNFTGGQSTLMEGTHATETGTGVVWAASLHRRS